MLRAPSVKVVGVGVLAGFLSGLFGVGGGILIVPGLVLLLKVDQRLAHGTSLAAVLPIAGSSLVTYIVHGNVDWPVAAALASGAVVGAIAGTRLLDVLPHRTLGYLFAVLNAVAAVRLFIDVDAHGRTELNVARVIALVVIGVLVGVLAGLLGVGGGVFMVPIMILVFLIEPKVAKGTSLAVVIPTSIMGTWRNRKNRNADLGMATLLGLSGVVSASVGGTLADTMNDSLSNVLFALLLLAVAARLVHDLRINRA